MKYITYAKYQEMGGSLDETTFNDLEYEARMYIDWYTFNRLHGEDSIPNAVIEAMYHIIKLVQVRLEALNTPAGKGEAGFSQGGVIASQSNDGVSVSYSVSSVNDIMEANKKELDEAVSRYLQGVRNSLGHRLLFRGLYPDEEVK